eukprot:scaffold23436_cov68-Phaeocystis_antarctica.AAC.3
MAGRGGVDGASLPPGACLRRRGRRGRRRRPTRCALGGSLHREGHRSGLPRHHCWVGCGLLGSGAMLRGLFEVADCVRVQCEFLVCRTSDLESLPELIGGGERAASEERGANRMQRSRGLGWRTGRGVDSGDSIARMGPVLYLLAHYFTACNFLRHAPAHLIARLLGHVEEDRHRVGVAEVVLKPHAHVAWVAEAHVAEAEQREQQHEQSPCRAVH